MTTSDKAKQALLSIMHLPSVQSVAADCILSFVNQGDHTVTTDPDIALALAKYSCPWCGKLHRSRYHDALAAARPEEYERFLEEWQNQQTRPFNCPHPATVCRMSSNFPQHLSSDNPEEYTP